MNETTRSNVILKLKNQVVCPVELALRILGGKWRGSILYQLRTDSLRFSELKYKVQDAVVDYDDADNYLTNKVLTNHLKELIGYELIHKINGNLEHVRYKLTPKGLSVIPILLDLFYWGDENY